MASAMEDRIVVLEKQLAALTERLARLETLVLPIGPGTVHLPLVNADGSLTARERLAWEEEKPDA